jgi:hypothetical protein
VATDFFSVAAVHPATNDRHCRPPEQFEAPFREQKRGCFRDGTEKPGESGSVGREHGAAQVFRAPHDALAFYEGRTADGSGRRTADAVHLAQLIDRRGKDRRGLTEDGEQGIESDPPDPRNERQGDPRDIR